MVFLLYIRDMYRMKYFWSASTREAVTIYVTYGKPEYWLTILHVTRQHMLLSGVAEHLQQAFYEDRNSSPPEPDTSTHADTEVVIHEDTPAPELANNQENRPPLASHLVMPPPSQVPPTSPQPLPTTARNRLKKLRRKRRQQRSKQLENWGASGVHIQNVVYQNVVYRSTVNNYMHWENCFNSSSPAK